MADYGKRLAEYRRSLGLTGLKLAERLGITSGTLSQYESGGSFPRPDKLEVLARMGLNLNWLLTGEGAMKVGEEAISEASIQRQLRDIQERLLRLELERPGDAVLEVDNRRR